MLLSRLLTTTAVLAMLAPAAALACEGHEDKHVREVTTADAGKLSKENKATFVDVNSQSTRDKYGIIPGALLLTSSSKFDASKELPKSKDQQLVFYCANTQCGASKEAAVRAVTAGYLNVAVLPAGIAGWTEAGLPVTKPVASKKKAAGKADQS